MKKALLLIICILCVVNSFAQKHYYDAYEMQTWSPKKDWSSKTPVNTRISIEYRGESTTIVVGEKSAGPIRLIVTVKETRYTPEGVKYIWFYAFEDGNITEDWVVRLFEKTPNGLTQIYLDPNDHYTIKYNVKPFYQFDY